MTQVYTRRGRAGPGDRHPGRARAPSCRRRRAARDGYAAVQLGFGAKKPQRVDQGRCAGTSRRPARRSVQRAARVPPSDGDAPAVGQRRDRVGDVFKEGDGSTSPGSARGAATRASSSATTSAASRVARHARVLPPRRLDRQPLVPGARLQGQAHGGPVRQRARHDAEPRGRRGARRARTCCSSAAPCPGRAAVRSWSASSAAGVERVSESWQDEHRDRSRRVARREGAVGDDRRCRRRLRRAGARSTCSTRSCACSSASRRAGTRVDQDARRRPRRRQEAVAAEGHRPGARRQHALADLGRWRDRSSVRSRATTRTACRSQARRAALRSALAPNAARTARLVVVDGSSSPRPKTKRMVEMLRGLGIDGQRADRDRRRATHASSAPARNLPERQGAARGRPQRVRHPALRSISC